MNYFTILGLKASYSIDQDNLLSKYKLALSKSHPDKYVNSTHLEREVSEKLSSEINIAYSTLSKPLSRAIYLLNINGIKHPPKYQSYISEHFDILETIEATNNPIILASTLSNIKSSIRGFYSELATAFDKEEYTTANDLVYRIRSLEQILVKAKQIHEF